jgi:hypothetical protein
MLLLTWFGTSRLDVPLKKMGLLLVSFVMFMILAGDGFTLLMSLIVFFQSRLLAWSLCGKLYFIVALCDASTLSLEAVFVDLNKCWNPFDCTGGRDGICSLTLLSILLSPIWHLFKK